ncbi:hypothetical protein D9M70_518880 [compost metagenome]
MCSEVEAVAARRQLDGAKCRVRQRHGGDVGGEIEDCGLRVADQRQVDGVDLCLGLALLQRPAEVDRAVGAGKPGLQIVVALAVEGAEGAKGQRAGRDLPLVDAHHALAVERGCDVDAGLALEHWPQCRRHQ